MVKMNGCGSWRNLYSATLGDVEYWTWLNEKTIGLVTDRAVFHWIMEEGTRSTLTLSLSLEVLAVKLAPDRC